jgi:LPS sulfotransferase NodH
MKILIFAHPRSGSNTLTRVLNEHPEIRLMIEPFNEGREGWPGDNKNYIRETRIIEDLDRVLEEIHKNHNGFKTLSYQLPEELNEYLLTKKGYKIIFLHRRNLLKTAISDFVAEQTKVWSVEDKEKKGVPTELQPLDIERMEKWITYVREETNNYLNLLKRSNIGFLEVFYEDLFSDSDKQRLSKIEEIFIFLGFTMPQGKIESIMKLLAPERKITDQETYNRIPNLKEIEVRLGSVENGFL